jgi:hypothetical protein
MAAKINFFSDWLMLKKSSPLKQLGQMEPNKNQNNKCYKKTEQKYVSAISMFSHKY